jgi:hypothetical protein
MLIKDQSKVEKIKSVRQARLKKLQDSYQQFIIQNDQTEAKNNLKAFREQYKKLVNDLSFQISVLR